ncbi:MAG TPA: hypothetical protein VFL90_13075 [Methylomirabilota bacterium]|nr:hypothetical protein [Methylomirabilota bacterium]
MNDDELRQAIRNSLEAGRLPRRRPPAKILASRSNGNVCDGCGRPIEPATIEYEVDVAARPLRLHVRCFDIWRDELS